MIKNGETAVKGIGIGFRGIAYLIDSTVVFLVIAGTQLWLMTPLRQQIGITQEWFHNGWNTQLYTLLTISLPVWIYFAVLEKSATRATLGKLSLGLHVVDETKQNSIGFPRAFMRTIAKLLPWELAHVGNNLPTPMMFADDPGFRWGFAAAGIVMLIYVASIIITPQCRTPYDILFGSMVTKRKAVP